MRIFLGVLSALSLLLAARRFSLSENTGYDMGALFFLLIGIQLLIAAALVNEHQQDHRPKSPASTDKGEGKESGPSGKQEPGPPR
ncbi:MAG: hypothetical protein HY038_02085 [Nitrospirae bacterium]|nr:hypothetical protein [Nitrospirota bacterium]